MLEVPAVMVLRGSSRLNIFNITPRFIKGKVLRRDDQPYVYCDSLRDLTVDRIVPASRGGAMSWMNTVAACRMCKALKADRTPAEVRMPLLFTPHVPSRFEGVLLKGRRSQADLYEWLAARLPKASRLS
ncbi:HNH endonuclease [Pseudacidovorax intermedius]|uniref:HNH endonuclease n=1 Tax=Pseudacidovorax intermedius TaxID=433924 RepID=UPI0025F018E7|nr:HNH endonuclease [Pseudacidovorax intermedius]